MARALLSRGLITILLFFSIPEEYVLNTVFHSEIIPGILLFIILGSALASNALIGVKKLEFEKNLSKVEEEAKNIEIESINPDEDMLNNDVIILRPTYKNQMLYLHQKNH